MLQWMGGSRRKVTTSRKSTHKRQKQYFEQKRRQQNTNGADIDNEGLNTYGQYSEKPKSLDILSLLNLATDAGECHSNCVNEGVADRVSPEGAAVRTSPVNLKTKASCHKVENLPLKNDTDRITLPNKYSSNKDSDKLDCWKTASEHHKFSEIPFLDLLGDDGSNENSEGSPMHEAHVAFSVEGLGKMGMETPVHSPRSPSRILFNGFPSPPKVAKRYRRPNKYMMDDLELKPTAMVHDINMPLGDSSLEFPFTSRGIRDPFEDSSTNLTLQGCTPPHDDHSCRINNFFRREGCLYDSWEVRSVFPDEDFSDERKSDLGWKNQSCQMDFNSADFSRDNTSKTHDFAFEDSHLLNREVRKEPRAFEVLESHAPYFKHLAEKDCDFTTLDGARYPKVDGSWDFNRPTWSIFATEDTADTMSLLSEESTSSTAVMGERAKQSASISSKLKNSMGKHATELCTSEDSIYSLKNLYAEDTGYRDKDGFYHGKNLKRSVRTKPVHHSKDLDGAELELEPQRSWLFEEEYTSIDKESGLGTFHRTSMESGFSTLECEFGSEDFFGAYPVSNSYTDTDTFHKRSKPHAPIKRALPFSFGNALFEKPCSLLHYDPIHPSISKSMSRNPATPWDSRTEAEPPYSSHLTNSSVDTGFSALSGKENVCRDSNEKSEFQLTECENIQVPEKEVSVGNNSLLSENGTTAPSYKDKYSECMETEDETPGSIEKSEPIDSPNNAEELLPATKEHELLPAIEDIPDKLEILINDKKYLFDAKIPFPSESGSKEKGADESEKRNGGSKGESSKDPSYMVMLESYVLQLLCVQKVLKEASEQDSNKKAGWGINWHGAEMPRLRADGNESCMHPAPGSSTIPHLLLLRLRTYKHTCRVAVLKCLLGVCYKSNNNMYRIHHTTLLVNYWFSLSL